MEKRKVKTGENVEEIKELLCLMLQGKDREERNKFLKALLEKAK